MAMLGVVGEGGAPAHANVVLTRADVEAILNRVELIQQGQAARMARQRDRMTVGDALRTAAQSQAQLRFNDGSLARVGERATFQFSPNTRNFRLSNGTVLLLIPPGRGRSTIQTPSAITGIQGSALVVRHIEDRDLTIVMALTNNPAGPMTVTPLGCDGGEVSRPCGPEYPLHAGQMALVQHNQVQILEFDLFTFYETSSLVDGLELDNPDASVSLGPDLDPVRGETLEALSQFSDDAAMAILNPDIVSITPRAGTLTSEPGLTIPNPNLLGQGQRPPSISPLLDHLPGISPALPNPQNSASASPPVQPTTTPPVTPPVTPQNPVAQPPTTPPPNAPQNPGTRPPAAPPPNTLQNPVAQPPTNRPPNTPQNPGTRPPAAPPVTPQNPVAQPPTAPPPNAPQNPGTRPPAAPPPNTPQNPGTRPPAAPPTNAPQNPVVQPPTAPPPNAPQNPGTQPPAAPPDTGVQPPATQPPNAQPPGQPNRPGSPNVPASPPPFQENPTVPARPPANPPVIFQP
ncbi:FecR family protein [Leptolyngbya sp. BL0902]|uniref:FecR family protein n=1 Tax=Leptolyngbya sp. BL0902 TaxID=1115757 RepID=UPI0018E806A4|nr:FecR family protein [Leptolyngbya sp. BL0902]